MRIAGITAPLVLTATQLINAVNETEKTDDARHENRAHSQKGYPRYRVHAVHLHTI